MDQIFWDEVDKILMLFILSIPFIPVYIPDIRSIPDKQARRLMDQIFWDEVDKILMLFILSIPFIPVIFLYNIHPGYTGEVTYDPAL